ncbi:MAG TPA: EamA family transporter [Candidatus Acidoferrum sp.]|nr:EamA family transporter [Candidatus Acidoferrum sp.]
MSAPTMSATIAKPAVLPKPSPLAERAAASNRLLIIFCFFAIYAIWGSTYLAIRYAVETIPPLYAAGIRHLTSGTILLLWCYAKKVKPTASQIRSGIILGVLFFLLGHGPLHWAETRVPSGLASLLVATEPIFVFFLAAAASKRWQFNWKVLAGVFLGLAGVGLLVGRTALTSGPGMLVASLAILFGALSWSAGIIYARRSDLAGHPLLMTALSSLSGGVLLFASATIFGEWRGFSFSSITVRSSEALAYLVVFGSLVAFSAYNWLLERYSPTLVATHTYVNPVVAVLLGWMLAGEKVTLNVGVAAAMVIGAVVLVDRGTAPNPEAR